MTDLRDQIATGIENHCAHPSETTDLTPDGRCAECARMIDAVLSDLQRELDQRDTEIERLTTIARVNGGLYRSAEQDVAELVRRVGRYRTAWASARIGRAYARQAVMLAARNINRLVSSLRTVRAERDQLLTDRAENHEVFVTVQGDLWEALCQRDRLREALLTIGTRCERFTGSSTCVDDDSRSPHGTDMVSSWCHGCIARTALDGMTAAPTCSCDGDPIECSHEAARGQAEAERDQLKGQLAAYETAICFETTCTNCARTLDNMTRAEAERDQHAATIARVRALHSQHHLEHCNGCGISVTWPCATIVALDQPDGFYEDDETVEKIQAAFEAGEKGITGGPLGFNASLTQPVQGVVYWNVCPDCFESHPGGAACYGANATTSCDCQAGIIEHGCPIHDSDQPKDTSWTTTDQPDPDSCAVHDQHQVPYGDEPACPNCRHHHSNINDFGRCAAFIPSSPGGPADIRCGCACPPVTNPESPQVSEPGTQPKEPTL